LSSAISVELVRTSYRGFVNNTYVLRDALGTCMFVDPAWNLAPYLAYLSDHQVRCAGVLITHYHYDHINLANTLVARLGVPVYVGRDESHFYGLSFDRTVLLEAGESIPFGRFEVSALVTPGHTRGSTCYLVADRIFTGDTVFNEGCGNCVDMGSDARDMYRSLQLVKSVARADARVYPGHSYGTEPGRTMKEILNTNIYFQIDDEDTFAKFRMRKRADA
jgi:hydroxyacylglutathione hydrolase